MSDKKQTAVEYLIEQLTTKPIRSFTDEEWFGIMGQAKQIEREQMIESYYAGTAQFANEAPIVNHKTPEDYYNEAYGK